MSSPDRAKPTVDFVPKKASGVPNCDRGEIASEEGLNRTQRQVVSSVQNRFQKT